VFLDVIPTPPRIFPVGFKWVFIRKKIKTMRWKDIKRGYLHKSLRRDPLLISMKHTLQVMNGISFRYLISLAIQNHLYLQLMDVVTAYLYGSLYLDIYMKVLDGNSVPNVYVNRNMYYVKLVKSLYGLK
jgi:hypothetical protein